MAPNDKRDHGSAFQSPHVDSGRRHDWGPGRPRLSRALVLAMLADTTKTLAEIANITGYSESWLQTLGAMHEIARPRGGDRRSAQYRARKCA